MSHYINVVCTNVKLMKYLLTLPFIFIFCFCNQGIEDQVDVVGLVNDTTATQLSIAIEDCDCHVGLILGTGTNACYMENLDAVKKYTGDRSKYSQVIINTEWGAFGDDGALEPWLNEFDKELDKHVANPGEQT